MSLIKFITKRKILVGLMAVLVLIVGSFGMLKLDKELMPALDFDGAYVEVLAGTQPATELERNVTGPLEKEILSIDGIESVNTTTTIGRSTVQVTFERGRGDELFKELESVVNSVTSRISGITAVYTGRYGTNKSYEFYMDISGDDMKQMTDFAINVLEPRLEALNEVRDVSLIGIQKHEIIIELDREKLKEKGLNVNQVVGSIQQENSEATLGRLNEEKESPSIRWNSMLGNIEDIKSVNIPTEKGFINLEEIAQVSLKPVESSSFVWKSGTKDFIFVQIGRVANVTQIEMADAIRNEIQNIRDEGINKELQLNEIVAESDYVEDSINGVTDNIMIGAVVAIIIMLLFLRNARATFIVGLAIPTSILLTFAAMWAFNYSINILTLIGLGLGVGMMVDSSIVILESIYHKKEQGLANFEAVIEGVKEVATAVIASMLTTIVVFLPIGLIGGEIGQFMIILSAVVAITLISSVIVSFTIIPSLSEGFLKLRKRKVVRKEGDFLQRYSNLVSWAIKKKRNSLAVIAVFFLMFGASLFLVTKIPMAIMPDVYNRYAEIAIDLETGVSLEEKEETVQIVNSTLQSIQDIDTAYIIDNGGILYAIINMTKDNDITREQKEINEEILSSLRDLIGSYPISSVYSAMSSGGGNPVQVIIKGESFEELNRISEEFIDQLKEIDGIVGVTNSIQRTSREEVVELKSNEIKEAGLLTIQVKQFIEQAFLKMPLGEVTINEEKLPIIVKWNDEIIDKKALLDLKIQTINGEKELSNFIELRSTNNPNQINHSDGERIVSISADIEERDLGAINRDVQSLIDEFKLPIGYSLSVGGDLEQQQELIQEMILVLLIAIFLVYLVMAVQFNSLVHPIIVMSVIPMTIIGVILGLFITQQELTMLSGMGIVMLIGIVLNNAILLIDRTNQLRITGLSVQEALIEAGKDRIRPIFMTTLTTVGGMLPLALASGAAGNYQAPMAIVIISGLLFATLITLLLIPSVYRLFTALSVGIGRLVRKTKRRGINKQEKGHLS